MLRLLLLFISVSLLGACAISKDIAYDLPSGVLEGPETTGERFKLNTAYAIASAHRPMAGSVEVNTVSGSITEKDTLDKSYSSIFRVDLGLTSRIDLKSDNMLSLGDVGPNLYGVKIQLLGDSALHKTKGLKWAALFKAGKNDWKTTFSVSGNTGSINIDILAMEAASILGYRYSNKWLAYTTQVYRKVTADSHSTALQTKSYDAEISSRSFSLLVGTEYTRNKNSQVRMETGLVHTLMIRPNISMTSPYFGIVFNRTWF
ncbi:MAG: hypothetical protein OEM38_01680 [Gammaproteobacteria bacterium]|nr:hypothetical protein [Gammaproteobacteria bacterium]